MGRRFSSLRDGVKLPQRATAYSAGYDFYLACDVQIMPGESTVVPTGVTAWMEADEVLLLFVRSGLAAKLGMTLQNGVGVVDADYSGLDIGFLLRNEGTGPVFLKAGERIGQGIFTKYLLVDGDQANIKREGGFGSTGRE